MAPKKDQDAAATEAIKALCILMATATEFTPNFDAAAAEIGIAQPRNVTRKINSIIEPVGYTMSKKQVVKIGNNTASNSTPTVSPTAKDTTTKRKTPAKLTAKDTPARKPLAKKVNVKEDSSEEEDEEEDEGDEEDEDEDGDDDDETEDV